jgi:PTH1 family peptidyl-tRNA hydrolase
MKIILAQGNPESRFNGTRHNVGFAVIDAYANQHKVIWANKTKFHAYLGETSTDGEKVLLVKPTTFYNETGVTARALTDFYGADPSTDLLVIHDELALPFGSIRTRAQGSDAGNNGIKSINNHVGTDYHRIRIGIANDLRERMDDADFVLGKFSASEKTAIDDLAPQIHALIDDFIADTLQPTTHKS